MKRIATRFLCICLVLCCILPLLPAMPVLAKEELRNEITRIELQKNKKTTELRLDITLSDHSKKELQGKNLQIFGFLASQKISEIPYMEPLGTISVQEEQTFSLTLNFDENPALLYQGFLVAQRYPDGSYYVITDMHYVDNPQFLANYDAVPFTPTSKKGTVAPESADVLHSGAKSTVIEIPLNEYLTSIAGEDTEPLYKNAPWYARSTKMRLLDYRIRTLTEAGVRVYLQFTLGAPTFTMGEGMDCLYPSKKQESAHGYAFHMDTAEGENCLIAFFCYMASRYGTNGENGLCAHWIIGESVNEPISFFYTELTDMQSYVERYARILRAAQTAQRTVCANGQVLVPVTNRYNTLSAQEGVYGAREFLSALGDLIRRTGDFSWQVAADISPSPVARGDMRYDPEIIQDQSSPYVSAANLSVLCDLLTELSFRGTPRSLLCTLSLSGQDGDQAALAMQSANYIYAFCQGVRQSQVEGVIYRAFYDGDSPSLVGGLYSGTAEAPGEEKPVVRVMRYVDTNHNETECAVLLQAYNVDSYSDVLEDFSLKKCVSETYLYQEGVKEPLSAKADLFFDFHADLGNFMPAENAEFLDLRQNESGVQCLYAKLYPQNRVQYMGISRTFDDGWAVKGLDSLSVTLKVVLPADLPEAQLLLSLKTFDGTVVTYEGNALIQNNVWESVTFDLSPLKKVTDQVKELRILVRTPGHVITEGDCALWVESLHTTSSASATVWIVILRVLAVIFFLGAAFYLFVLICNIRNHRRRLRRRQRLTRRPRG